VLFMSVGLLKGGAPPASWGALVWLALAIAITTAWSLGTRPPSFEVGADGLSIRRAFGPRFIPFSDLASVDPGPASLTLRFRNGRSELLRVPAGDHQQVEALAHRLRLGIAAESEEGGAARTALLSRERRSVGEWRASLRAMLVGDAGYRRAPLTIDELDRALTSAGTSNEVRLAAALGLRAIDAPDAAARIRIAAEACAQPRVRVALQRVADEEEAERADAAVEEAIRELAPTEGRDLRDRGEADPQQPG
jgi:hypothetical protein